MKSAFVRLLRRWIFMNGAAEAIGLGTTFVVGGLLAPLFAGAPGAASIFLAVLLAVVLGTLLEGVVVGVAQERVLRDALPQMRRSAWTRATAAGAAAAWTLGMVPSTIFAVSGSAAGASGEPEPFVQYALAGALGLAAGPVLGFAQWRVLRRHVADATAWLWANAAAWAAGMPVIFLGMDYVPWQGPPWSRVAAIYIVCGAAGGVVGAIHGVVLVRLLQASAPAPDALATTARA